LDVDDALWDDIQSRTQGAGESVADYVMSVRILLRRLTTTPSSQQLRLLMKNLRPDVKLCVRESDVESIDKLISMGKEFERLSHEVQRYKPPPGKAQAYCSETAFDSRGLRDKGQLMPVLTGLSGLETGSEGSRSPVAGKSRADEPVVMKERKPANSSTRKQVSTSNGGNVRRKSFLTPTGCWNCQKAGHRFRDCRAPKKVFCYLCGKVGKKSVDCGCRGANNPEN